VSDEHIELFDLVNVMQLGRYLLAGTISAGPAVVLGGVGAQPHSGMGALRYAVERQLTAPSSGEGLARETFRCHVMKLRREDECKTTYAYLRVQSSDVFAAVRGCWQQQPAGTESSV
jgi:hypothetical protein